MMKKLLSVYILLSLEFFLLITMLIGCVPASNVEGREFLEVKSRRKRIVDRPPRPTTTLPPLTSEEQRERKFGTESPHIDDYPEEIFKAPEVTKGEWVGNPIPKINTKNVTTTTQVKAVKNDTKKNNKNGGILSPVKLIQSSILSK